MEYNLDDFSLHKYWCETRDKNVMCPSTPMAIAAHCDWAHMIPCMFTGPHPELSPRTIDVHPVMLPHFVESTLAGMNKTHRFILITGGSDGTIPRAFYADHDFRGFNGDMKSYWGECCVFVTCDICVVCHVMLVFLVWASGRP